MGRNPYTWTPEIEDEILARIAKGQSVARICEDDWLPSERTFYNRLDSDPAFVQRYLRAREQQADRIFEECLAIADSQEGDVIVRDGVETVNHDAIARAKLRIDTRMRMAGKLRPKVYGDKIAVGGADDLPPVKTEDVGGASAKLASLINAIAERSGTAG